MFITLKNVGYNYIWINYGGSVATLRNSSDGSGGPSRVAAAITPVAARRCGWGCMLCGAGGSWGTNGDPTPSRLVGGSFPGAASATQTVGADLGLLLHGAGRSTLLALAPPPALLSHANAAAQPGIPILLRGPRRSTLPSQAQKCLLLLSGFYLLSAPSPTLELSQGQAQVLSQPSQVCTCSG